MERTWETDIKEQVHCGWVRVCERETERVPGCLHSLSCSLRGALSMSGSTYWSNSEPEWLSWLQGQSRKAAHKKRTGHRFYCFCALMSFFSAAGANPDHAVDLAYSTSYVTCPFCPTSSYLPPSVLEPVDGSVRLKKKTERRGDVRRTEPPVEGSDFICKHCNSFCLMFTHLSYLCSVLKEKRSASENNP